MTNQSAEIQIFLLCYERTEYVAATIGSLLAQTDQNFELVISDNSPGNSVEKLINKEYPQLRMIRRTPSLQPYDHLNAVLGDVTAPLFMIFHDDDLLEPNALAAMTSVLVENTDVIAVSCNARILRGTTQLEIINPSLKSDWKTRDQKKFANRYLNFLGINPFPGYLYRRQVAEKFRFNTLEAGHYADMTFLTKLLADGSIYWLAAPLMQYRKHAGNASSVVSFVSVKRVIRFFENLGTFGDDRRSLERFRTLSHFFYLRSKIRNKSRLRSKHLLIAVLRILKDPAPMIHLVASKVSARIAYNKK